MSTVTLCGCGRRRSRDAHYCRRCHAERMDVARREVLAVVQAGSCPQCGSGLHRNLALSGWWQCDRFAAGCSWQGFTC